jgi:glycosyltransferase involved in cell wall biosynthesis
MLANREITVLLSAYNAAETLGPPYDEIPDDIVLIDDDSKDATVEMTQSLEIPTVR